MLNHRFRRTFFALLIPSALTALPWSALAGNPNEEQSQTIHFRAPAGDLPTTREIFIEGFRAAILPNGRFITPAGIEVNVDAPKPFGLALSPDGQTLATINSGASRFSVSLIRNADTALPAVQRVNVDATFMGVVRDVLAEFLRHGFRRFAVLNWHYENVNFLYEAVHAARSYVALARGHVPGGQMFRSSPIGAGPVCKT